MLIVLDTNVLVSALIKRNSFPGKILDAILEGKLQIVLGDRIFYEYQEVLHRPRLSISAEQADTVLRFLNFSAYWISGNPIIFDQKRILDLADIPFAEALIYSKAEALITGNIKHFTFLSEYPVKLFLPQEFIKTYGNNLQE